MLEELGCGRAQDARWGEDFWLEVPGWGVPQGGLETTSSSSEEQSSDAPRMNLRRSLASGPELSIGTWVLVDVWVTDGKDDFSELTSEDVCRAWEPDLTSRPPETMLVWGPLSSLCCEAAETVDTKCLPSSSGAGGWQPDGDSSPFPGIATVLLLIFHRNNIHRIKSTIRGIIQRHSPEAAMTDEMKWFYQTRHVAKEDQLNFSSIKTID